ncbi:hypothetical protein GCM10009826_39500 [Humibacillus xanthopallidus]
MADGIPDLCDGEATRVRVEADGIRGRCDGEATRVRVVGMGSRAARGAADRWGRNVRFELPTTRLPRGPLEL